VKRWKRRLFIVAGALIALIVVGGGILWILKPWVPDIVLTEPGPTGERIVTRGVFANYFPAKDAEHGPALMLLGGSEGGIGESITSVARALQKEGFSVLSPSYFGAPGQPGNLELVPLETFDRALGWLSSRVGTERIAVVGQSKGAEAALLVGVRHPELRAVVASAPSSYAWPGIDWESFKADASWTSDGEPLPVLPYGPFRLSAMLRGDIGRVYVEGLEQRAKYPDAAIAVEKIRAPVLLVCGEDDDLWPACPMSRQLRTRAATSGDRPVRVLAYEGAGHHVFGPPVALDHPSLARFGGTPSGNNAARTDAWPKLIEFLRTHLR
jgi:dienelactone hydrolase